MPQPPKTPRLGEEIDVNDLVPIGGEVDPSMLEDEAEPVADFKTTTTPADGTAMAGIGLAGDPRVGVVKSLGQTVIGAGELVRMIPGVDVVSDWVHGRPGLTAKAFAEAHKLVTPRNPAESVGKFIGDVGQTILPGQMVTKAGLGLAARLPRGLQTAGRMAVEGAGGAGMAAVQGSDPTVAGTVSAALVPAGKVVGALAPKVAPAMQEAVDFARRRGIPVDLATTTGSRAMRAVQDLIGRGTVGGAVVRDRAQDASHAALARTGKALAAEASPAGAVVKEQAGQGMRDSVTTVIRALDEAADTAYDRLRTIEALPSNLQTVQIGTRTVKTGVLAADGTPITRTIPITKDVALPVDMRPVKDALRPKLAEWEDTIPQADRDASPGLLAIRNLVNGDDVVPASAADKSLSAIKRMARGADLPELRNVSQGLAATATAHLEDAVQTAVAQGGPAATAARNAGRAATVAKYDARDVFKAIREEPVQAFNQAVYVGDAGIKHLREVANLAPTEMPKVGRAYIEDLMTKATAKGGFGREAGLFQSWQNLGPETKKLLFPNPMHRRDLDAFFLLATKVAENSNPSGSGFTAALGAQGYQALVDPLTAAGVQLSAAALATLLYSPRGVKLLTQGLKVGTLDKSTAANVLEQLRRAATSPAPPSRPAPARTGAAR